jgi:hypothetical protein
LKEKTYSSVELKRALEKGYTITKIYSALEYKKYTGLMRAYVEKFIKLKIENTKVLTQEECNKINKAHKDLGFNFEIKPENTKKNPGLRAIAKLCLNSLWGKFGQRSTLSSYDFYYDYNKLLLKMSRKDVKGLKWHIVNGNCVELRYEDDGDIKIEADYISEITAVFTVYVTERSILKLRIAVDIGGDLGERDQPGYSVGHHVDVSDS